jgi:tetratricopeptide (TPR) repeat protein
MCFLRIENAKRLGSCVATISLLIFSALSASTFAQAPAESRPAIILSGTVRDPAGAPVPDASVIFEEKATGATVESKTKPDGTFSFLALRAGTYLVRARSQGFRETVSSFLELSLGQRKQIDLVLSPGFSGGAMVEPPPTKPSASKPSDMEFSDQPNFTVAGVTDWTNVGGHGSDTKLRTSESLARETLALKSGEPGDPSGASESARAGDSHRVVGDRAEASGDAVAAEHEYEEAVRLNPSEENYFAWGAELLLHRAIKPAAGVFTKGTAAHPKSRRMLAGLGAALYAGGDYANAARRVCEASDLQPADPAPYLFLGKMEKAGPDPLACAAEKLARFAHDQPANALANYYLAVAIWKRAQRNENPEYLRKCESLVQKAIAADPKLTEAYVQLGMVHAARADFRRAIEAYKKAIEVNPQSSEGHYRLGLAYKRVGEEGKSEHEMELYKQADKNETAAVEQQRREIRQFVITLKDQPQESTPQLQKQKKDHNEK